MNEYKITYSGESEGYRLVVDHTEAAAKKFFREQAKELDLGHITIEGVELVSDNALATKSFQSTLPVRGATAKTAKKSDYFCENETILQNINLGFSLVSKYIASFFAVWLKDAVRSHRHFLCACVSHLNHQHIRRIIGFLCSKMFDFVFIAVTKVIKPQAILLRVHNLAQLRLQTAALCRIQQAFKDGVLYALTVVYTLLGNLPKTFAASGVLCVHIVGN